MAAGIKKNHEELSEKFKDSDIRCLHPFRLFCVDSSPEWLEKAKNGFPEELKDFIVPSLSRTKIGTFGDRLCHYYENLPDVIPDFIYLDGPANFNIEGNINGLTFNDCAERTPLSADILLMEPVLTPGCMIVVDGRMNNSRFIKNNLQREWKMDVDYAEDRTTFELKERPLGIHNRKRLEFQGLL